MTKPVQRCSHAKRILLSGVFGPYGVDDDFGRKENIMELFHNQVTREQGAASFRFHHRSFGLYFLAQNVDADVTVLDFPSQDRFAQEVQKGYDAVGISFIAPNFKKAQEMAAMVRRLSPRSEIILGGHGAAIENIDRLIDCDHVVRGEGIGWLRRYLGQDSDAPIFHPTLVSAERASIFGVPLPGRRANLLVPGVGCINGCDFCCTSHFFSKRYTSYLHSGSEMFHVACRIADETGVDEFFVMDENFLKDRERALDLLSEMERHQRFFSFHLFSSAEAIYEFGLDNLERLGVSFIWIGVESRDPEANFAKNSGIDPKVLVSELRSRGIVVLASAILCAQHHTQNNIQAEIDYMVELRSDFVQFMLLTPLPVTALYRKHKAKGLLRTDLPFEEIHGQKELAYHHPEFPDDQPQRWLERAFRQDYEMNSSSMLRVIETVLAGYRRLQKQHQLSEALRVRKRELQNAVRIWGSMIPVIKCYAVNPLERQRANRLDKQIRKVLPLTMADRFRRLAALVFASAWQIRLKCKGDMIQPRTLVTHYPASRKPVQKAATQLSATSNMTSSADIGQAAMEDLLS